MTKPRTLQKQTGMNGVLLAFLLGMATALAILLPFWIIDKGLFIYAGDYNEQQVPFYMSVVRSIHEGGGTWSWATDIGSDLVTSYSFYNLGSPFLWLSALMPARWLPFAMVPLFVLKFGAIAAAACLWLSRYARTRNIAVICSLIYAFCGFNIYNIFFNHMLDPVVIFALMMWALDGFMYDGRRGLFALFVGLSLLNSYFFFLGNVTFVVIYFVVKLLTGEYTISLKNFGLLALEAVIGVGIGMVLALPSFYTLIANPRTNDFADGLGILLYGNVHQYFNVLLNIIVPPDPPYLPNLLTDGVIKWTSMSAFLPIVSVAGVIAYCRSRKGTAAKWMLGICLLSAMVPVLNSSFYALNSSYYARWYYMPLLIMCFVTMRALEEPDINIVKGADWALGFTALYAIFGLLPTEKDGEWVLGAADKPSKFWLTFLTALLGVGIFWVLVRFRRKKVRFAPLLLGAVMGFSVFYGVVHLSLGKFPQWESDKPYKAQNYDDAYILSKTLPDEEFYRIDSYETTDNMGLWMNRSSIRTFNSTVSPSIMEFNPLVGVKRDVSSKPARKLFAHRGLMSVKYTIVAADKTESFEAAGGEDEYGGNRGWKYLLTEGDLAVYENENFVPLGFTYDKYIWLDHWKMIPEDDRSGILMRAIALDYEQVETLGYLLPGGEEGRRVEPANENETLQFTYDPVNYERYVQDCNDRRSTASYETDYGPWGFSSKIRLDRENLVFYAVPYDEGWTATVNGEVTPVYKVSGGLMAVYAPAGDNEIVFTFKTKGLSTGASITILSLSLLVLYLALSFWFKQRKQGAKRRQAKENPAGASKAVDKNSANGKRKK